MIVPFFGEFSVFPVPLELSLDPCSHGCAYCYARLNRGCHPCNWKSLLTLVKNYRKRETLVAHLLQQQYPIFLSNHSDPFAESQSQNILSFLKIAASEGIRFAFATKGGRLIEQALVFLSPSVWYVTIEMLDDKKRAAIAPNAPNIQSRVDLVKLLKSAGHRVIVGINPCVPQWLGNDFDELLGILKGQVEGVFIEGLHLTPCQISRLSSSQRTAIGEMVMRDARKLRYSEAVSGYLARVSDQAEALEIPVYTGGRGLPSSLFNCFYQVYPRVFPIVQNLVNYCWKQKQNGSILNSDEYLSAMGGTLLEGEYLLESYIQCSNRQIRKKYGRLGKMSFRSLFRLLWQHPEYCFSPIKYPYFSFVQGRDESERETWVLDEQGFPLLIFSREGFTETWVDMEDVKCVYLT